MLKVETRRLLTETLPPLTVSSATACRSGQTDPMPRLRRILCVLAALALPALGITVADSIHRAGDAKATQAAAPVPPSNGAAAPPAAVTSKRALRTMKTAAVTGTPRAVRS